MLVYENLKDTIDVTLPGAEGSVEVPKIYGTLNDYVSEDDQPLVYKVVKDGKLTDIDFKSLVTNYNFYYNVLNSLYTADDTNVDMNAGLRGNSMPADDDIALYVYIITKDGFETCIIGRDDGLKNAPAKAVKAEAKVSAEGVNYIKLDKSGVDNNTYLFITADGAPVQDSTLPIKTGATISIYCTPKNAITHELSAMTVLRDGISQTVTGDTAKRIASSFVLNKDTVLVVSAVSLSK